MECPKCGSQAPDQSAFCPACGEQLPPQGQDAAYAAEMAEYQRKLAEYEQQKAAYDQQYAAQQAAGQPQGVPPAYQPPVAPPQYAPAAPPQYTVPAPPKKKRTGCIIAAVVVGLLLLCSIGTLALGWKAIAEFINEQGGSISVPADRYDTADEAVQAALDAEGNGDYYYEVQSSEGSYTYYWAGPPASEYVEEIVVEEIDGQFQVINTSLLSQDQDVYDVEVATIDLVYEHLLAVYEDRGLDAQALTVDPFYSDSASAQVSGGGLTDFTVDSAEVLDDGTVWVSTTQVWYGNNEYWDYYVVPTDAGYRISDIAQGE